MRSLLLCCVGLHLAQQLCGINAVFYYSTSFFEGVIANPAQGTTLVAVVNVLATWVAQVLMDRCGRRTLLLWSSGGMLACAALLTAALRGALPKVFSLGAVMGYVSFFEIGLGPIPWLIVAEMFEAAYVDTAQSIACQVNWVANFVVGAGFPFMNAALGGWAFVPFMLVLVAVFCFALLYLPETLGRTTEEIKQLVNGPQFDVAFRGAFATENFGSYDEPEDDDARRQLTTQYRPQPGRSPMRRM